MTNDDILDRKLTRRFQTFDVDNNGRIERRDFENSAIRLADEFGRAPGTPARERLLELSLGLWDRLVSAADADGDGTIDLGEYKRAFTAGLLVTEESFEAGYRPFLEAIMAVADTDGDGQLNLDEYIRWTGALMNLPESDARAVHPRLDTDGDGLVGTDEILQAIRGYYFDESLDGPGGWLLGSLPN